MQLYHPSNRWAGIIWAGRRGGAVALFLMSSPLAAAPLLIEASHERNGSSFVLEFPDMGDAGRIPAEIAHTDFDLEVDAVAGTATFRNYFQTIDSLNLFGVETGDIEVTIVASVSGVFHTDGTFETVDTYEIRYFRDLSALGLPPGDPAHPELGGTVELTSTSNGRLVIDPNIVGRAELSWEGSSQLSTPMGAFPFNYLCTMAAAFSVSAPTYIALDLQPLLDGTPMPDSLKDMLGGFLDAAVAAYNGDNLRAYFGNLSRFIRQVERSGSDIAPSDATALINDARIAMSIAADWDSTPLRSGPSAFKRTTRADQ